jgi:hypothetical protein
MKKALQDTCPKGQARGHSAIYNIPPTEEDCGWEYRVELDAEDTKHLREVARTAGMTLEAYITGFLTGLPQHEGIPNQEEHRENALPTGKLLTFDFVDEDTIRRLQRVAEFVGKSFEELVSDEFESTIELYEGDMIFHPQTGEIIADDNDRPHERLGNSEHRLTARPLGERRQKGGEA